MIDVLEQDVDIKDSEGTWDYKTGDKPAAESSSENEKVESTKDKTSPLNDEYEESATLEDSGEDSTDAQPKKFKGVQKRIDELTKQRYDAERNEQLARQEAQHWKNQVDEKTNQQKQTVNIDEPKFENFESYEDYIKALADHRYDLRKREDVEKQQAYVEQQKTEQVKAKFIEQTDDARKKYSDFDEVAFDKTVPYSQISAHLVFESNASGELAYYLGKNPDIARKIAELTPVEAAKEIGRLEARVFDKPASKPKKLSDAPDPIKTVGGKEKFEKNPSEMDSSEYRAWRMQNMKGVRRISKK